jgi:membrane protease YdiL (CAAX protease family)
MAFHEVGTPSPSADPEAPLRGSGGGGSGGGGARLLRVLFNWGGAKASDYDSAEARQRLVDPHKGASLLAYVALQLLCLSPTVFMVVLLVVARLGLVSMFVFHWVGCVAFPALFMWVYDGEGAAAVVAFATRHFASSSARQWRVGALFFVLFTLVGLGTAGAVAQWCEFVTEVYVPIKRNSVAAGIQFDPTQSVLFSLYFIFVNSLIEELFWRGFLLERLGTSKGGILTASFYYALYHFWVLFALLPTTIGSMNIWLSLVAMLGLFVFGAVLALLHMGHGIAVSWLIHAAGDAAVCFFLLSVWWSTWVPQDCPGGSQNMTTV